MIALATRRSALARAQTALAIQALKGAHPEEEFSEVVLDSDGDLSQALEAPDRAGEGWFTSRLERALLRGEVDGAVHSAKDLPTTLPDALLVAAYLARADPRDALVARRGVDLTTLPPGSVIGTGSPRRAAQLSALRPDCRFLGIRGNVETRLRQVEQGGFDAVVLALAGLIRLGREGRATILDPRLQCTPAPAQGAIALEAVRGGRLAELAESADHGETRTRVEAERLVLSELGGGCRLALGALAEVGSGGEATLTVAYTGDGGEGVRRVSRRGRVEDLPALAVEIAQELQ